VRFERQCADGHPLACMMLGRGALSGAFFAFDAARGSFQPATEQRTGVELNWALGMRLGVDFWNWWATNTGFKVYVADDPRQFTQPVQDCEIVSGRCENRNAESTALGATAFIETGLQRTLRLAHGIGIAPGAFVGHAGTIDSFERDIQGCDDCYSEPIDIDPSGTYLAANLRFVATFLGLSLRYERYLSGDLVHTFGLGLDVGIWPAVFGFNRGPRTNQRLLEQFESTGP
jgi:hypothetical protein